MAEQAPLSPSQTYALYRSLSAVALELGEPIGSHHILRAFLPLDLLPAPIADRFTPFDDLVPKFGLQIADHNDSLSAGESCIASFSRFAPPDGRAAPPEKPPYTHIRWSVTYDVGRNEDQGLSAAVSLGGVRQHRPIPGMESSDSITRSLDVLTDWKADMRRTRVAVP